jgi:hypothetical protein
MQLIGDQRHEQVERGLVAVGSLAEQAGDLAVGLGAWGRLEGPNVGRDCLSHKRRGRTRHGIPAADLTHSEHRPDNWRHIEAYD